MGLLGVGDEDLGDRVEGLSVRLELGIPEGLLWLGSIVGRELDRGDYLALQRVGATTPDTLFGKSDEELLECLGSKEKVVAIRGAKEETEATKAQIEMEAALPMPRGPAGKKEA